MLCYEIASHALLWFLKGKSFDSIAIVFLSELVLVTVGIEVGKVPFFKLQVGKMFFGQTTGGQSVISPTNKLRFLMSGPT